MTRFIIRYGVFTVLALMLAGIVWMANTYSINQKQSITLFVAGDSLALGYTAPTLPFEMAGGDTLAVNQTPYGNFQFIIEGLRREPSSIVFYLRPLPLPWDSHSFAGDSIVPAKDTIAPAQNLETIFSGNTMASGYINTGKEKIGKLILQKLFAH